MGSGEEEEIKKGDVCVLLVHRTCTQLGRSYTYIVITDSFQTHKRLNRTLFIRIKHNMRIFGVIPFIKLQNDS